MSAHVHKSAGLCRGKTKLTKKIMSNFGKLEMCHCIRNIRKENAKKVVPDGFFLYGDPPCPLRGPIIMSSLCQSVEWGFGKLLQLFPFLDYKKNLKLFLQPVANYYIVETFLINAHIICLYGSQKSTYFGLNHPEFRGIFAVGGRE